MITPATTMQNRLEEIAALRCIGIILVVLGHSFPVDPGSGSVWIYRYIGSIDMPLFMCISGYLFRFTGGANRDFPHFVRKKAVLLLIPYFVLSTIAFVPKALLGELALRPVAMNAEAYAHSMLFPLDNAVIYFWYLPTLFLISLCGPLLIRTLASRLAIAAMTAALVWLDLAHPLGGVKLLDLAGVASYLIFFWIGCVLAAYRETCDSLFKRRLTLAVSFVAILLLHLIRSYWHAAAVDLLLSLCGIALAFAFGKLYASKGYKLFAYLDGFTFQIYLLSWYFQSFVEVALHRVLHAPVPVVMPAMFVAGLLPPVWIARWVAKHKPALGVLIGMKTKARAKPVYERAIPLLLKKE
ncbi:acyltransferase family protein [Paenibacillus cymbidii]|uniref:acyltransferase family protein n=1 Tax=Paenibacillus cymbidii TaxID=1639034 RepID=UPI001436731D|nr:acyltransferase [Paenibacillus cymbidii]